MPPRWLALTIIAFWLATAGWLVWRDLWPRWRPGEPPPYHIDLIEEVTRGEKHKTLWTVFQNDHEAYLAKSWVKHHPDDDTFAFHIDFSPKPHFGKPAAPWLQIRLVSGMQRVTREGSLREMEARFAFDAPRLGVPTGTTGLVAGTVRGNHFVPRLRLDLPGGLVREANLAPVEVSYHGSVLVPQQPVNRVQGLRPGQRWRMPLVEPFTAQFGLTDAVRYVNARVLPEARELEWKGKRKTCLVIEYDGDEQGSTWVEAGSGLVQRQEAAFGGNRLVLQRDD